MSEIPNNLNIRLVLDDFDLELACDLGFGAWAWLCPLFVVLGFAPYSWRLALPPIRGAWLCRVPVISIFLYYPQSLKWISTAIVPGTGISCMAGD